MILVGNNETDLKTSQEWQEQYSQVIVLDPDGWDRMNFHHSWHEEKISIQEYNKRLMISTCMRKNKK